MQIGPNGGLLELHLGWMCRPVCRAILYVHEEPPV
jgi:hypothetical protein